MSFFRFFGFEFYCCGVGCVLWLVGWFSVVGMGSNLGWICSGGSCGFQCGGGFAMVFWIWVLLL